MKTYVLSDSDSGDDVSQPSKKPKLQQSIKSFVQKPSPDIVPCPICNRSFKSSEIMAHANECADNLPAESQSKNTRKNKFSSLWDDDIFDSEEADIKVTRHKPKEEELWNLASSFTTASHGKRKCKRSTISSSSKNPITVTNYPESNISTSRGCFNNYGNNPGKYIQSILKSSASSSNSDGIANSTTFQDSSSSSGKHNVQIVRKNLDNALIPDGEGGFIINDDIFESDSEPEKALHSSKGYSFPSLASGVIDFHNQFKESSSKRKLQTIKKKSPRKRSYTGFRKYRKGFRRGSTRGKKRKL